MSDDSKHFKSSILAIFIIIAIIIAINLFVSKVMKVNVAYKETLSQRISPLGLVYLDGEISIKKATIVKKEKTQRTGKNIYTSICSTCHKTGIADAPKFGNKSDWAPRIKQGIATLLKVAISGKGSMPPRGTCLECSDTELKSAILHMLSGVK